MQLQLQHLMVDVEECKCCKAFLVKKPLLVEKYCYTKNVANAGQLL